MAEIFYKEESYAIIGCCIEVWKTLGYGFSEVVYKDALEIELNNNELPFIRENEMNILYKGKIFGRDHTECHRVSGVLAERAAIARGHLQFQHG